jgi:hypothetical protein
MINEIIESQKKSKAARVVCDNISSKLLEIENVNSDAHVAAREIPMLLEKKQSLQADLVLGSSVKQSDIDQVNKLIEKASAELEYHTQTVLGLKSKLSLAQDEQRTFDEKSLLLFRALVEGEAEEIHKQYIEHAKNLLSLFRRLLALSLISGKFGGNCFRTGTEHREISIPVFQFVSSGQWPSPGIGEGCRWIPAAEMARTENYAAADEESEVARLAALGIELPNI